MPFVIRDREYSYEDFIDVILRVELEPYRNFKLACYLTDFDNWYDGEPSLEEMLTRNGFLVQDLGDIKRGLIDYDDKSTLKKLKLSFYFYLDESTKVLYSFSDIETKIIKDIFGKLVNYENNIYTLFIGASSFYHIMRRIKDVDNTSECVYFSAKHLPTFVTKGKIRSDKKRTIVYYASDGDGNEALFELREMYGVLPRIMQFRMSEIGTFEIQNIGLFSIRTSYSDEISRLKLLEITEILVEDILKKKMILSNSKYRLIPLKTKYKTFNVPQIKSWSIHFGENLEDEQIDYIIDIFNREDFSIYNSISETGGSFRISGMVADGRKNSLFSVHINNEGMVISPLENCSFDTFLRFFEVVVENIGPLSDIREVFN